MAKKKKDQEPISAAAENIMGGMQGQGGGSDTGTPKGVGDYLEQAVGLFKSFQDSGGGSAPAPVKKKKAKKFGGN